MTAFVIGCCFVLFNSSAFAECDGEAIALTTEAKTGLATVSEMRDAGTITINNDTWTPVDMDAYTEGMEWQVQFDDGIVTGYAGCTATKWSTTQAYNTLTSVNSGCACSLDKTKWRFTKAFSNSEAGSTDRTIKSEYCRSHCPMECAARFASNQNSLRTNMINDYGSCPAVAGGGVPQCDDDYYWNGEECTYKDNQYCIQTFGNNYFWNRDDGQCVSVDDLCPAFSETLYNGPWIEIPGRWFDFNGDGQKTIDECVILRGYANYGHHTADIVEHPVYRMFVNFADLQNTGDIYNSLNINTIGTGVICRYNTSTGNYDASCTNGVNLCSNDEILDMMETAGYNSADLMHYFVHLVEDYTHQSIPESNYSDLFTQSSNDTQLFDRCSGVDEVCPAHSQTFANGPIAEMVGYGVDFNDDDNITLDECIAGLVYGNYGYYINSMSQDNSLFEQFPNFVTLYNLAHEQNTFDGSVTTNNGILNIAFCKYNSSTGNYDANCTPAVSAFCSNQDLYGLNGTNFQTRTMFPYMITKIENSTGTTIPKSSYSMLFTNSSSNVSTQNICPSCPFGYDDSDAPFCEISEYQYCSSGTYSYVDFDNEYYECRTCEEGHYCPYDQSYSILDGTQGMEDCPTGAYSNFGSTDFESCTCSSDNYYIKNNECVPKDDEYCELDDIHYYWNDYDMQCVPKDTEYCQRIYETQYAYWDDISNTCEYDQQSACLENPNSYWDGTTCVENNPDTPVTWSCADGITPNGTSYSPNAPLDAVMYNDEEVIIDASTYYEYDGANYTLLTGSGTSYNLSHATAATNKDYDDPIYLQYMAELEYYIRGMDWVVEFNGATLHGYSVCNAGSDTWTKPYGGVKTSPLSGTYNGCSCSLDKQRWVIIGKPSDDSQYSGWAAKNEHCRETCPYLCAQAVATDSTFRQTVLNNSCEIPEWNGGGSGSGGGGGETPVVTCDENQLKYGNTCIDAPFSVTTTPDTSYFKFSITAQGTYYVDWGDGSIRQYTNNQAGQKLVIEHDYSSAKSSTIRIGGTTEAYSTESVTSKPEYAAAISFTNFNGATNTASAVAGISGSLAQLFPTIGNGDSLSTQPRFFRTFNQCTNLSGDLPEDLFSDLSGQPVEYMFYATFMGCTNITGPIPQGFFGGVTGQPASYMFDGTFSDCSGLGTKDGEPYYSIPEDLFINIQGTTIAHMFPGTFFGCSGLTGSIPRYLFRNVSGEPKERIFAATFEGCSSLTGSIPKELFQNISGSLVDKSFRRTFKDTTSLESWVPPELFANMNNNDHVGDGMLGIFESSGIVQQCPETHYRVVSDFDQYWDNRVSCSPCTAGRVTNPDDNIGPSTCHERTYECYSGEYLYVGDTVECRICPAGYYCPHGTWTVDQADESKILCPEGTTSDEGTMDEYGCVATPFEVDVKPYTNRFTFRISAKGSYIINWGDGNIETIDITTAEPTRISHDYAQYTSGETYTISIGSKNVTEYYTGDEDYYAAITFGMVKESAETNTYDKLIAIRGSLGAVFPTIDNGDSLSTQPRFAYTFNNCDKITTPIPQNIFQGVHGAPVDYMFFSTFGGCIGITGTITNQLFANIAGETAEGMFSNTFYNCKNIDSIIPENLFAGIYGSPKEGMYANTFTGCKKLHGTIPPALFGDIRGNPAVNMYSGTFDGCSGLTGDIPDGLFGEIYGPVKDWMYYATFYGCTGLSGYIPVSMFNRLSGNPAWMMFQQTFYNDADIIGFKDYSNNTTYRFIPKEFFGTMNHVGYDDEDMSMYQMFTGTALYTKCPIGYYKYTTGFDVDLNPKVSCTICPEGTTTLYEGAVSESECVLAEEPPFSCDSQKYLRVGDSDTDKICLSNEKPNTASLVIKLSDGLYYVPLSTDDSFKINNESNKKMKVLYNGNTYNAHDGSVQ